MFIFLNSYLKGKPKTIYEKLFKISFSDNGKNFPSAKNENLLLIPNSKPQGVDEITTEIFLMRKLNLQEKNFLNLRGIINFID